LAAGFASTDPAVAQSIKLIAPTLAAIFHMATFRGKFPAIALALTPYRDVRSSAFKV
jgi:hypothetical protein